MTLKSGHAPHLRRQERAAHIYLDILITLVPLVIFSAVYYGLRPVMMVLSGMISAVICEWFCCLIMRKPCSVGDFSAMATGGLIGAMMSPLTAYWVPAVGAAFAIIVVKMPFGGTGRQIFCPAAAGMALVTQCFPTRLFTYPDPGLAAPIPLNSVAGVITETSPAAQIAAGATPNISIYSLALGDFPGPIGATAILVLIACMIYLFTRRTISPLITLPYLAVCAISAAVFPRISGTAGTSVMLELCTGYLLFAGIYLFTETATTPRHWLGRIVFGALSGIMVMMFRHMGAFEAGACFAVLIMNAFAPLIDRACWFLSYKLSHHREPV